MNINNYIPERKEIDEVIKKIKLRDKKDLKIALIKSRLKLHMSIKMEGAIYYLLAYLSNKCKIDFNSKITNDKTYMQFILDKLKSYEGGGVDNDEKITEFIGGLNEELQKQRPMPKASTNPRLTKLEEFLKEFISKKPQESKKPSRKARSKSVATASRASVTAETADKRKKDLVKARSNSAIPDRGNLVGKAFGLGKRAISTVLGSGKKATSQSGKTGQKESGQPENRSRSASFVQRMKEKLVGRKRSNSSPPAPATSKDKPISVVETAASTNTQANVAIGAESLALDKKRAELRDLIERNKNGLSDFHDKYKTEEFPDFAEKFGDLRRLLNGGVRGAETLHFEKFLVDVLPNLSEEKIQEASGLIEKALTYVENMNKDIDEITSDKETMDKRARKVGKWFTVIVDGINLQDYLKNFCESYLDANILYLSEDKESEFEDKFKFGKLGNRYPSDFKVAYRRTNNKKLMKWLKDYTYKKTTFSKWMLNNHYKETTNQIFDKHISWFKEVYKLTIEFCDNMYKYAVDFCDKQWFGDEYRGGSVISPYDKNQLARRFNKHIDNIKLIKALWGNLDSGELDDRKLEDYISEFEKSNGNINKNNPANRGRSASLPSSQAPKIIQEGRKRSKSVSFGKFADRKAEKDRRKKLDQSKKVLANMLKSNDVMVAIQIINGERSLNDEQWSCVFDSVTGRIKPGNLKGKERLVLSKKMLKNIKEAIDLTLWATGSEKYCALDKDMLMKKAEKCDPMEAQAGIRRINAVSDRYNLLFNNANVDDILKKRLTDYAKSESFREMLKVINGEKKLSEEQQNAMREVIVEGEEQVSEGKLVGIREALEVRNWVTGRKEPCALDGDTLLRRVEQCVTKEDIEGGLKIFANVEKRYDSLMKIVKEKPSKKKRLIDYINSGLFGNIVKFNEEYKDNENAKALRKFAYGNEKFCKLEKEAFLKKAETCTSVGADYCLKLFNDAMDKYREAVMEKSNAKARTAAKVSKIDGLYTYINSFAGQFNEIKTQLTKCANDFKEQVLDTKQNEFDKQFGSVLSDASKEFFGTFFAKNSDEILRKCNAISTGQGDSGIEEDIARLYQDTEKKDIIGGRIKAIEDFEKSIKGSLSQMYDFVKDNMKQNMIKLPTDLMVRQKTRDISKALESCRSTLAEIKDNWKNLDFKKSEHYSETSVKFADRGTRVRSASSSPASVGQDAEPKSIRDRRAQSVSGGNPKYDESASKKK